MKLLVSFLSILFFSYGNAQELQNDANTLLLLHFNNTTTGASGETPIQTNNITYQPGVQNQALYISNNTQLRFDTLNNFYSKRGTIEFWVRPEAQGGTMFLHQPAVNGFNIGVGAWTVLDVNLGVPGFTRSVTVPGIFDVNTWYHLAFTWDNNSLKLYKNGQLQATTNVGYDLPLVNLSYFNIGSTHWGTNQVVGRIDEFRISKVVRTPFEILQSYLLGINVQINNLHLTNSNPIPMYKTWKVYMNNPGWWRTPEVYTVYNGTTYILPNSALTWTIADTTKAKIINGDVFALNYGTTQLTGTYNNLSVTITLNILTPTQEPETLTTINPQLSTPANCREKLMPVVIIAYFPTLNGTHIDQTEADQWFPVDITLVQNAKTRVQSIAKHAKFSLEEGSKFRGHNNANARPYLGYEVVDIIYVYEPIPRGRPYGTTPGLFLFEPYEILNRFGGEDYVNTHGVKEFWIFGLGMSNVVMPESNMSSPTTGDVSNSFRINDDLPVYDKTFILYGYNYSRSGNEAVHNHGHQIEAMMDHVNYLQDGNTTLFWTNFVGRVNNQPPIGRCGDTHHPPNTTQDYDYHNLTLVNSDILNWLPSGGTQTQVNKFTWENMPYPWPPNMYFNASGNVIDHLHITAESDWYILWMQSIPGFGQQIPYNTGFLSNWWKIICDWDDYYNKGLYRQFPDATPNPCGPICGSVFTDPGGNGSYPNNSSSVRIFCPNISGEKVKMDFTSFQTQALFDKLYVYDGPDIHYPLISSGNGIGSGICNVAGGFWGNLNSNLPGPFLSTHDSGCLTFRFCSDNTITDAGWNASVSCIACTGTVSTKFDNVEGSLRWEIYCAQPNDVINFSTSLTNDTLQVSNSPLIINKNLSILQNANSKLNIKSVGSNRLFDVLPGKSFSIKDINLYPGIGIHGRAIRNQGTLTLNNVSIYDHNLSGSTILNSGILNSFGSVYLNTN